MPVAAQAGEAVNAALGEPGRHLGLIVAEDMDQGSGHGRHHLMRPAGSVEAEHDQRRGE